jgi:hypothetical protein
MIVLTENKKPPAVNPVYLTEAQLRAIKKVGLFEANNLPAIAKTSWVSTNPRITQVTRQDTIFDTVQAMGIKVKINAMQNVVAEDMPDQQTAVAVASTIYQQFGVKCSFTVTYEGVWKCYWSPKTPVERAPVLAYAKATGLPPPNPRKYLA